MNNKKEVAATFLEELTNLYYLTLDLVKDILVRKESKKVSSIRLLFFCVEDNTRFSLLPVIHKKILK